MAMGAAPGPARAGPAVRDLVRAGRAMGRAGRVRPAAAVARPGPAPPRPARPVLGRLAGAGVVFARGDGRLVASAGALVRAAGSGAGADRGLRGQHARTASALRHALARADRQSVVEG